MKPVPDKPLRTGYTTGTCATAATKLALQTLITGTRQESVSVYLPAKQWAHFSPEFIEVKESSVKAGVKKDAGDDPDVTHGAVICAEVSWASEPGIHLDGGEGVGRATKPGLDVQPGEAAINPVPRRMILEAVDELLGECGPGKGVSVVISIPNGEELAKKTLNARLGILGGLSILGTSGIVRPFSTSAFRASIVKAIEVAVASGCKHVAATTGGRSEKFAMEYLTELPEEAFIEMGDFVGFTLKHCKRLGIEKVTLAGMPGKFSKVAQGVMMVHSKSAPVDMNFLAEMAKEAGATAEEIEEVKSANTATHAAEMMAAYPEFFTILCRNCSEHSAREARGGLCVETLLFAMKGQLLGKAEYCE
ncbi:cobalt-precorrin-5B (C(1))-methyltransferase [Domibacillus epiphyticus]|uniref:Cobalt-precorrin-5B C(1)-methyltransferase n=1 Tax=Domibacillus epiphyticus TaxID=1714355 RepID=A0A1V2A6W6_9BACI|nr:cobalt-precorrin-5B (C(1))-methyltransferase [Domibacillus epiphyticus]OMP66745.1 cobalt-precorrin-5B (C(1))-methyltransferase [Domibacillus epiphyticus]